MGPITNPQVVNGGDDHHIAANILNKQSQLFKLWSTFLGGWVYLAITCHEFCITAMIKMDSQFNKSFWTRHRCFEIMVMEITKQ
jgi:hypothetical protein